MIYPDNYERKIGIDKVRALLKERCLSPLGKLLVDDMAFSIDAALVNEWMEQVREFHRLRDEHAEVPMSYFFDVRPALKRIRLENTHFEVEELFDFRRSLETIHKLVEFIRGLDQEVDEEGRITENHYEALYRLADGVTTFPVLIQQADQIVDRFGHVRDTASPELNQIRRELARVEGAVSRTLHAILRSAQADGVVDKDVAPSLRDGRLVIPVAPGMKRKINGIVHDESASGRTLYIEPTEVVEANNKIRDLENQERQEIIRILTTYTKRVRPHVTEIIDSYDFLAQIDFIQAKDALAETMRATAPEVSENPIIDWIEARHPLLESALNENRKDNFEDTEGGDSRPQRIIPLEIMLKPEARVLIISGPNAGGKSVCLKTVGLLQYMLQMGLPIPISERSKAGIFDDIMMDIGDEQSLENDLSTYSSHLVGMKRMIRQANSRTLILIDEFGTGTEPQIGGAIAQAVLEQFWKRKAWAVITTHYQNLKHFAEDHPGVANGAMLYDRHQMRPLFQLAIGRPGSSFAIEIARKIGLPEEVIKEVSDIVGSDYIQSDKYLQDIVRDKRYWEAKRQTIHAHEKELEKKLQKYESLVEEVEKSRKDILGRARAQAEEMIHESNKRIENTIREIREHQAEKEETRKIRQQLAEYEQGLSEETPQPNKGKRAKGHGVMSDEDFQAKVDSIRNRKERHEKRLAEKASQKKSQVEVRPVVYKEHPIDKGDTVRIKGLTTTGTVEMLDGKMATVIFGGGMRTKMRVDRLEHVQAPANKPAANGAKSSLTNMQTFTPSSTITRNTVDAHIKSFKTEIDLRGMRGDEALMQVQYFIDDAILAGASQVRILHGKGNGILRQMIRQYLATVPNVVSFRDEHVQFGGAGITVVEL